jgi:hypothetical protein
MTARNRSSKSVLWRLLLAFPAISLGAAEPPAPPNIQGVYQPIADSTILQGKLRNSGSPAAIPLLPLASGQAKFVDPKQDPWKMCQPIGPFRIMALQQTKIELLPVPGMIVMLFEDLSHGLSRIIHMQRGHPEKLDPSWLGDAVGRWEDGTLVVDSSGFNDSTWLNEEGAQHSELLHLVEHIRPVLGGKYLEYRMTADDPKTLKKPYTYTRYYEKLDTEILEDSCEVVQ